MDETTKILIGTISGFVIAFFAEPIKLFFQNAFKKRNLRVGLYCEIYNNYKSLMLFVEQSNQKVSPKAGYLFFSSGVDSSIRTECFHHFLSHEPELFYQLREAVHINTVYGRMDYVIKLGNQPKKELGFKEFREMVVSLNKYIDFYVEKDILDKSLWNKVKDTYSIHI